MFDWIAYSPLGFWTIAVLIVLADSVVLLDPGDFTFRFARATRVRLRAAPYPFLLLGREPVITLFAYPGLPFLICSMQSPTQSKGSLRRLLLQYRRIFARDWPLSLLVWLGLTLTVVVGPMLSLQYGAGSSISMIWPAMYALAGPILGILWWDRDELGMRRAELAGIAFEFLVCPFLLVNTWKKIAVRHKHLIHPLPLARYCADDPELALKDLSANLAEKGVLGAQGAIE